jgi:hypothetical protein
MDIASLTPATDVRAVTERLDEYFLPSVTSIHSLQIRHRIPIWIAIDLPCQHTTRTQRVLKHAQDYDSVCRCQIEPDPSSQSRYEEEEDTLLGIVEPVTDFQSCRHVRTKKRIKTLAYAWKGPLFRLIGPCYNRLVRRISYRHQLALSFQLRT